MHADYPSGIREYDITICQTGVLLQMFGVACVCVYTWYTIVVCKGIHKYQFPSCFLLFSLFWLVSTSSDDYKKALEDCLATTFT